MSLEIIELTEDRVDEIYEIECECFNFPWSKNSFSEEIKNPLAYYILLIENRAAVGYAGMWQVFDEGHITNIAVKKERRNKGYGGILIDNLTQRAKERGVSLLTLEVRASNEAAQRLYKKNGFEFVGVRKRYYEQNEDAFLFNRNI